MKDKTKEIGSFFTLDKSDDKVNNTINRTSFGKDNQLFLSGRTALDFIIKDIKANYPLINIVHLPDYLCESILIPFRDNGFTIKYYKVKISENNFEIILEDKKIELILIIDYFGNKIYSDLIYLIEQKKPLVIYDFTHSFLDEHRNPYGAEYGFASIRKWFGIPNGGIAVKYNDKFSEEFKKNDSQNFSKKMSEAMILKEEYQKGNINNILKKEYLTLYKEYEEELNLNYRLLDIDNLTLSLLEKIDIEKIKEIRISNYLFLLKELSEISEVSLIRTTNEAEHVPLFLPALVKDRNKLREYFIENRIYLPVHWDYIVDGYDSYDIEYINNNLISFVIDQRYNIEDMKYIIEQLKKFYKKEDINA